MRTPETSRPRSDLPWLRHRRAASAPAASAPAAPLAPPAPPVPASPSLSLDPPARPAAEPPPRPAAPTAPGLSLGPPPTAPAGPPAPTAAPSLSLGTPPPPSPAGTGSPSGPSLLDLSPPQGSAPARARTPRRTRPRTLPYPRVARGRTVTLTATAPTVTLTRLQSGIGHLRITFARGASTGDLSVGMLVQQDDGSTYVVQALGQALQTPPAPLPLVRLEHDELLVDLHLVPRLRRALVYAFSPTGAAVNWDGLLALSTQDGSRVETALNQRVRRGTCALLTVYNVHGELVLRSEMAAFDGPPEQAAEAYGFHYAWLDGRFPSR